MSNDRPDEAHPAPIPLLVVAGLPRPTSDTIVGTLERRLPVRVVSAQFGHRGPAAYDEEPVRTLLERACAFALRDRAGRPLDAVPSPSALLLAYVDDPGWERLVDAFGVAPLLLPMRVRNWTYPSGQEWRAVIEPLTAAALEAFDLWQQAPRRRIRQRLEARSSREPLLLPMRNFQTDRGPLFNDALECMRDPQLWNDFGGEIERQRFTPEQLPRFHARTGGGAGRYPVDQRGLVFANTIGGRHGPARALLADPKPSAQQLRSLLESMFRFGTPLLDGFQHDVQWPEDDELDQEAFECCVEGEVFVSGTHANVYPNDFVRESGGGQKVKGRP